MHLPVFQIFLSVSPVLASENHELILAVLLLDSDVARSFCRPPSLARRKETLLHPIPFCVMNGHRIFPRWPEYSKEKATPVNNILLKNYTIETNFQV